MLTPVLPGARDGYMRPAAQVLLLAIEVSVTSLRALQATSAVLDALEYRIEPCIRKKDAVAPLPPETPQLLPAVHLLWAPLLVALKVSPQTLNLHLLGGSKGKKKI